MPSNVCDKNISAAGALQTARSYTKACEHHQQTACGQRNHALLAAPLDSETHNHLLKLPGAVTHAGGRQQALQCAPRSGPGQCRCGMGGPLTALAELEPVSKSVPSLSDVDVYPEKRGSLLFLGIFNMRLGSPVGKSTFHQQQLGRFPSPQTHPRSHTKP